MKRNQELHLNDHWVSNESVSICKQASYPEEGHLPVLMKWHESVGGPPVQKPYVHDIQKTGFTKITISYDSLDVTENFEMLKWKLIDILTLSGGC